MPIQRARPLRALAVRERSRAADAADRAEAALASIETEIAAAQQDLSALSAPARSPRATSGRAALLEAGALDREARLARSRELADRLARLESDREAARRDMDAAKEALAKAIRKVEALGDGVR